MEFTKGFTKSDTKIMKGIAICLMLYHHLFAFPERVTEGMFVSLYYFNDTNLSVCLGAFGKICVPLFTILSGYGCYISSRNNVDTNALVKRRIVSLYKTYWTVFFVCLPILVYKHRAMRSLLMYDIIYNFLGLDVSFNEEWWFVLPFTLLLMMFPIIKRFIERQHASFYLDLFLLIVLNTAIVYIIPEIISLPVCSMLSETTFWARIDELLEILPSFIIGCIFARYDILKLVKEKLAGRLLWCVAAIAGMCSVFLIRAYNWKYYDFLDAAVFIICITVLLPTKPMILLGKVFEKLGEESTYMWLVHSFFCYYWLPKLTYMPKYSPLIFLWLLVLSFVSAKIIRLIRKYFGVLCDKLAQRNGAAA